MQSVRPTELKIFMVDDDNFNLKVTAFHLKRLGYQNVTTFNNGSDCLANLSVEPDVVFLDQYMDDLQGIDVLRKLQQLKPSVVVVVLSAEDSESSATFFKEQGAFDYIIKGSNAMTRMTDVLTQIAQHQNK